jgi:hypothetical protein
MGERLSGLVSGNWELVHLFGLNFFETLSGKRGKSGSFHDFSRLPGWLVRQRSGIGSGSVRL